MIHDQRISTNSGKVRTWKCGELPMPEWVPGHIAGGIAANGTSALTTELGHVRVHPGNVVIERCGTVWVRQLEEAADFIDGLELIADPTITNIGPGKTRQFGTDERPTRKTKSTRGQKDDRRPHYRPPVGSQPSIEWIHLNRLSIDEHRWMAACRRNDIPQLPCCVFRYESLKEEARMFIVANRARKPIDRLDDYYAALAAEDMATVFP